MKIICKNKYELIAKVLLLPTLNLNDKYYSVLLAVMSIWKKDITLDDDLKNLLCEKLGYVAHNKWHTLVSDLNKLTNIHKDIGGVASPLIIPNFEKRNKNRKLRLHPQIEKLIEKNFTTLTVEYTYR